VGGRGKPPLFSALSLCCPYKGAFVGRRAVVTGGQRGGAAVPYLLTPCPSPWPHAFTPTRLPSRLTHSRRNKPVTPLSFVRANRAPGKAASVR